MSNPETIDHRTSFIEQRIKIPGNTPRPRAGYRKIWAAKICSPERITVP